MQTLTLFSKFHPEHEKYNPRTKFLELEIYGPRRIKFFESENRLVRLTLGDRFFVFEFLQIYHFGSYTNSVFNLVSRRNTFGY